MVERPLILQCPACRELVTLGAFTADHGVFTFDCPACRATLRRQATSHVSAPITQPVPAPRAAPPSALPVAAAEAVVTAAPPVPSPAPVPAAPVAVPAVPGTTAPNADRHPPDNVDPGVWKAWLTVVAAWDQPRAHDAFVATCSAAGALPFAGTRYRDHLAAHPADPMAVRGRERVLGQAMVLAQSRTGDVVRNTGSISTGKVALWAAMILMLVVAAVQLVTTVRALNAQGHDITAE